MQTQTAKVIEAMAIEFYPDNMGGLDSSAVERYRAGFMAGYKAATKNSKKLALMSYDAGFKYAAEQFRNEPTGEPVQSVGQFIDSIF